MGCMSSKKLNEVQSRAVGVAGGGPASSAVAGLPDATPAQQLAGPLNGKKRSLLIGINYQGHNPGELRGCINDVKMMCTQLAKCGFPTDAGSQRILTEEPGNQPPTRSNIEQAFDWLVAGAAPGDNLFLHYSGHGGQQQDKSGEESDGKDETLVPLDFKTAGQIPDDTIYDKLVKPLPQGCRLTVIFDCCHSGTAMDLPYSFKASQPVKTSASGTGVMPSFSGNSGWISKILAMVLPMIMGKLGGGMGGTMGSLAGSLGPLAGLMGGGGGGSGGGVAAIMGQVRDLGGPQVDLFQGLKDKAPGAFAAVAEVRDAMGDVVMYSGCMDEQCSADVGNIGVFQLPANTGPGGAGGACTSALLKTLNDKPGCTFAQALEGMRQNLVERNFKQMPQLSSSKNFDLQGTKFTLA